MLDKITDDQYQELLDVMDERRPDDIVKTFAKLTGIIVKPYTGYQFFDAAEKYLGDYNDDSVMEILEEAGIEVLEDGE